MNRMFAADTELVEVSAANVYPSVSFVTAA